jgi:hypothetical protein
LSNQVLFMLEDLFRRQHTLISPLNRYKGWCWKRALRLRTSGSGQNQQHDDESAARFHLYGLLIIYDEDSNECVPAKPQELTLLCVCSGGSMPKLLLLPHQGKDGGLLF